MFKSSYRLILLLVNFYPIALEAAKFLEPGEEQQPLFFHQDDDCFVVSHVDDRDHSEARLILFKSSLVRGLDFGIYMFQSTSPCLPKVVFSDQYLFEQTAWCTYLRERLVGYYADDIWYLR